METKLKRLDRRLAYSGTILDMYTDTMLLATGKEAQWDILHYKPVGGACIVAPLEDGRIVMTRQYRPAVERITLELPAGQRDRLTDGSMEDPSETARRELWEETGYTCKSARHLLSLQSAVAYCDETTYVFLAEGVSYTGRQHLDGGEEIEVALMEPSDLTEMIYSGEIKDVKTLTGLLAYFHLPDTAY